MPRTDDRSFIFLHDGMPDHPKVEGLSDAAFRLLITLWCYCRQRRTDGIIRRDAFLRRGTPKARKELLAELIEELPGGDLYMHDWLDHQPSVAELEATRAGKSTGGSRGNHVRWHVKQNVVDPDCKFCADDPPSSPTPPADTSHMRSDNRSEERVASDIASESHETRSASHSNMYINPPYPPDKPGGCDACRRNPKRQCRACRTNPRAHAEDARRDARRKPPHCADPDCDPETRMRETERGMIRCPDCHPLAGAAVVVPLHPGREVSA